MKKSNLAVMTQNETRELKKHESVIKEGLSRFIAVGHALNEIRNKKLYREHFESFGDYLGSRWEMSPANASRLIKGAEVATRVPGIKNEGQAREVSRVPYTDQNAVFSRAQEIADTRGCGVTASIINEAASEPSRMTARPDGVDEAWDVEGVSDLWQLAEDTATELRSISRKIAMHPQGCWFKGQLATVEQKIKDVFTCLRFSKPHSPCKDCAGGLRKGCAVCRYRGWIPESIVKVMEAKKNRETYKARLDESTQFE